jgi:hypothetical protein
MSAATVTVPEAEHLDLEAEVRGILNRRPAVGLAVGVVGGEGLEFFSPTVSPTSPPAAPSPRTRSSGSGRSPRRSPRSP